MNAGGPRGGVGSIGDGLLAAADLAGIDAGLRGRDPMGTPGA